MNDHTTLDDRIRQATQPALTHNDVDPAVLTRLAASITAMPQQGDAAVESGAAPRLDHWRARSLVAAAGIGAVVAIGLVATHTPSSGPAPAGAPETVAFSVALRPNGTVAVVLPQEQLVDGPALRAALTGAGVPSVVVTDPPTTACPAPAYRPTLLTDTDRAGQLAAANAVRAGSTNRSALIIDPTAIPAGWYVQFVLDGGGGTFINVTNATTLTCTAPLSPPDPELPFRPTPVVPRPDVVLQAANPPAQTETTLTPEQQLDPVALEAALRAGGVPAIIITETPPDGCQALTYKPSLDTDAQRAERDEAFSATSRTLSPGNNSFIDPTLIPAGWYVQYFFGAESTSIDVTNNTTGRTCVPNP